MRFPITLRFLIVAALICCQLSVLAQDKENGSTGPVESSEPGTLDDLPEHAVWRFGKFGENSGSIGYYRMAFSPDGKYMVARDALNHFRLFDVRERKLLFEFESYADRGNITNLDFSPNSKYFLVASEGPRDQVTIWDVKTGELHSTLQSDAKLAFFNSNTEVTILKPRKIHFFDVRSGKSNRSVQWGDSGDYPQTFSRSGNIVLGQRKIQRTAFKTQVFDLQKKTTTVLDTPTLLARSSAISSDGNYLAAKFHRQNEAYLWDLRDPHNKENKKLAAHTDSVQAVCFSPDNRFLVTTGWDKEVYLWDVLSREKIGMLSGHGGTVNACSFSPHDFLLATGANGKSDSSLIFWDYRDFLFPADAPKKDYVFDQLWKDLASREHRVALDAVAYMMANPEKFNQEITNKLGVAAAGASGEEIEMWIAQLGSRRFAARTAAEEKLKKSRMRAEDMLKATLERDDIVLEVKYRIQRILTQPIERPKIPKTERDRLHRTIYALELIGNEAARQTLENLADAHSHVDIARDAANSLRRVRARIEQE
jgi:WD40 repeat protein